jgi:exopolyphosphatase/guanosine-5'-triphosphate,3'-diphosphate pyrophosphatase
MGITGGITPAALTEIVKSLTSAKHAGNVALAGLASERIPVFPGGVAILRAIFEGLKIESLQVSSGALREGLLQDLIGRVGHEDVRENSVADLARRYHVDSTHAANVAETAQQLFVQVAKAWNLDEEHGRLLRWSAALHEIGMDVSHSQYHKHGHYLLLNMDLAGFSQSDKLRLALIVRAQRRKFPELEFDVVASDERKTLVRLAILLRLAVVLRRNRTGEPLPEVLLEAESSKLTLTFPDGWLDAHPLTYLDLELDAEFLGVVPFNLKISG